MSQQIYINGEYFSRENAKVSVYDHGLLYGDGVFEGMRIYSGRVFRLQQHLVRLWESAAAIALPMPISIEKLTDDVNECVAKNALDDGYIRLVVTRGAGPLGLDPYKCSNPQIIIIADKISLYPEQMYEDGLELVTAATIRNHPAALSPRIKSLNYLNNIMAKMEGLKAGCVEAVMLNTKGEVAECTGDNLFIVRRGELSTPPIDAGILEGITRGAVLELAKAAGIKTHEVPLTRHDIFIADECFLTGSAAEVIAAVKLDDRVIGNGKPGPVTTKLNEAFRKLVREQ
ncbi:branched-chain-amino-acid transaminase [Rubripirellula amarantea]|uniref:Branched-chain-amino-acid aminotransferase n=1 Tax=Rubripirellula amarantea TaxID=2527999 RepID=A0A5C5WI29_9BACT|nr:branched-chain-amino-acid transaminase [Rubripirellula amarantea]MDA8743847.1 branched-chain-amino-acid transaminase [Rubripirellula amarantea]TWT49663.1 Branched-chain-amino-acid aminotransferase [Rubripirellula amarantea]